MLTSIIHTHKQTQTKMAASQLTIDKEQVKAEPNTGGHCQSLIFCLGTPVHM